MASPNLIYRLLKSAYGPQGWWPGETPFEVAVGAILTQNVAWKNVETAIASLKKHGLLEPAALDSVPPSAIAPLIRSTGYFNQKALKLKNFLSWFSGYDYSFRRLAAMASASLRKELLGIKGVGPETADSILLYALSLKVFVVDAYTRRLFQRLGMLEGGESYEAVQGLFHRRFRGSAADYNEYHALIVNHGKNICRKPPRCAECVLKKHCAFFCLKPRDRSV